MLYGEKYALIYVKKYDQDDFIQHLKKNLFSKGKVALWGIANLSSVLWQNELWQKSLLVSKKWDTQNKILVCNDKKILCPWDETPQKI